VEKMLNLPLFAMVRLSFRKILPEQVLGKDLTNTPFLKAATGPISDLTEDMISGTISKIY